VGCRKGIFFQELEKKLAHHKADERKYGYKLEVYQRTFLDFVCESPTSIEALGQDEDNEVRPNGMVQKEDVEVEEPQILKGGGKEDEEP
jgi:hypothetical protein